MNFLISFLTVLDGKEDFLCDFCASHDCVRCWIDYCAIGRFGLNAEKKEAGGSVIRCFPSVKFSNKDKRDFSYRKNILFLFCFIELLHVHGWIRN